MEWNLFAMTICLVLALPYFSKSFVLEIDACETKIGVMLMQATKSSADANNQIYNIYQ